MDPGPFVERLQRSTTEPLPEAFDPGNELHVDAVARHLLQRFRQSQDVEAFTLLYELVRPHLQASATRITRRLLPAADPEDLVAAFMSRLFTEVAERPGEPVRRFLALAHTAMRNDAFDQLRQVRRAQLHARAFHEGLDEPADPAVQLQQRETQDILGRFGEDVLRAAQQGFAALDVRDQQVLVAREIVHLSYERVAGMLGLQADQVGMIIRRARQHLLERMAVSIRNAAGSRAGEGELALIQDSLGRSLDVRQGLRSVKDLLQRMLEITAEAGRRKLADLVYEMAKACLVKAPGFSERMLDAAPPRRREQVAGDVARMAGRLQGTATPIDVSSLQGLSPEPATALRDARICLAKLAEIEGPTGRQQVAQALLYIHAGEPAAAEALLLPLLDLDLAPATRQNAHRNLVLALLRQDRHAEALARCERDADEWPQDAVRVMNLCYAAARLGQARRFEAGVTLLCEIQRGRPDATVARWLADQLPRLAAECALEGPAVRAALAEFRARPPHETA